MKGGVLLEHSELEILYETYNKELFLYAFSLSKSKHLAEDLVSDAFFQLALQNEFPKNTKFWLFAVVKNRFIDGERKKKRWGFFPIQDYSLQEKMSSEDIIFKNEQYKQLYQAIDALKPPYKEITLFFYFLDWSTKDIAQFLNLSTNQVRVALHRSRNQLKETLQND